MKTKLKKLFIILLTALVTLFSTVSCNISFYKPSGASLEFTLTKSEVDSYLETASQAEKQLPSSQSRITVTSYVNNLVNGLFFINEQFAIAQINYFTDMTVEKNKQNYNFALTSANQARASYKNAFKAVWLSNSPFKSEIFSGMSDDEVNALFNAPSKVNDLELEIDELTSEYLTFTSAELQQKTGPIYAQIVTKYNEIATLTNFDNYYTYASQLVYERDYEPNALNSMTNYVKTYIVPLYTKLHEDFYVAYSNLSNIDKQTASDLISKPYNSFSANYISEYVSTLNTSSKTGMNDMFNSNNYVIATSNNAYDGAFTIKLQHSKVPYCYFGPSYQDMFTVIHELGHYSADYNNPNQSIPLDVAEIHSQANELLFLISLSNKLPDAIYKVLTLNCAIDAIRAIIASTIMNEFEMKVFKANVSNYTSADFDAIMTEVINDFGKNFLDNVFGVDLYNYWKRAIIQQPCYYVSYAVSGITALGLYAEAVEGNVSYQNALIKYDNLITADFSSGLTKTLNDVKISNPFSKDTYTKILNAYYPKT